MVSKNAAPHSGSLAWLRALRDRIQGIHGYSAHWQDFWNLLIIMSVCAAPMDKLKGLSLTVLTSDSGIQLIFQCNKLLAMMEAYEVELMQDWRSLATLVSQQKLYQPVLMYVRMSRVACEWARY